MNQVLGCFALGVLRAAVAELRALVQAITLLKTFVMASRANGMYERQYQAIASICTMQKMNASHVICSQSANTSVSTRQPSMTSVATRRWGSNMRRSCFIGPIKNSVLNRIKRVPKV